MNRYIVKIDIKGEGSLLFLVFSDESADFVQETIEESQKEFHFSSACDLMDYICSTYDFQWADFEPDICYEIQPCEGDEDQSCDGNEE